MLILCIVVGPYWKIREAEVCRLFIKYIVIVSWMIGMSHLYSLLCCKTIFEENGEPGHIRTIYYTYLLELIKPAYLPKVPPSFSIFFDTIVVTTHRNASNKRSLDYILTHENVETPKCKKKIQPDQVQKTILNRKISTINRALKVYFYVKCIHLKLHIT